ncbi:MAG: type II toxin-antitoxin system RelE/ParE family toxin [Rhodospirillales bacterium]|nr:type II toxin-antitoxin system RelE/ParE family toxin [Rhodospirillales bacterium]
MTVVFSPLAERDLEEIGDHIARDNPRRALSFIMEIRDRCREIEATPHAAPLRDEIMPGARMIVHGNYLIFYRAMNREIRIERVLHGARDIQGLRQGIPATK